MAIRNFIVNLTPEASKDLIQTRILEENRSGLLIDEYVRRMGDYELIIFVLEKYYMRSSNRASLTVTIDNIEGKTKVHVVAAGSSEGLFRFDWGASKNFSQSVEDALQSHIIG